MLATTLDVIELAIQEMIHAIQKNSTEEINSLFAAKVLILSELSHCETQQDGLVLGLVQGIKASNQIYKNRIFPASLEHAVFQANQSCRHHFLAPHARLKSTLQQIIHKFNFDGDYARSADKSEQAIVDEFIDNYSYRLRAKSALN